MPLTLHLSVPMQVKALGAQGSTTDMEREAVTDNPVIGPLAIYDISQGEVVVALVKFAGGALTVVTEIVPEAVSTA